MNVTRVLVLALLVGGMNSVAAAQSAQVVRSLGNNRFEVVIGRDTMVAFPDSALRRMLLEKNEGDRVRKLVAAQDSIIAQYDRTVTAGTVMRTAAQAYVTSLEEQVADYEKLAENYRKLLRGAAPRLSVVGGVGATGSDTEPALMAGVELGRLRVLWFGQENNQGVLAGGSFRIF